MAALSQNEPASAGICHYSFRAPGNDKREIFLVPAQI